MQLNCEYLNTYINTFTNSQQILGKGNAGAQIKIEDQKVNQQQLSNLKIYTLDYKGISYGYKIQLLLEENNLEHLLQGIRCL